MKTSSSLISPGTLGCARDCAGFSATTTKVHGKKQLASGHIYCGPAIPPPRYRLNGNTGMCTAEDMSSNLTVAQVLSPIQSGWDQKCGRLQISSDVGIGRIWWFPRDRTHV